MTAFASPATAHRVRRRVVRVLVAILVVILLITVAFGVYVNMVAGGDRDAALKVWNNPAITVTSTDHSIVLEPSDAGSDSTGTGLVFIPGAKVDPYAYLYKLSGVVEQLGVTVVITKPTLNLAFFDNRPLTDFTADAPDVTTWLIGGHSLGGVRACQLADDPAVSGLVLFGSYCATDLSETDLEVTSISAENDGLSTPQKIEDAAGNLPDDTTFVEIPGANHASFGDYGRQSGDGEATMTSEQAFTAITEALSLAVAPRS